MTKRTLLGALATGAVLSTTVMPATAADEVSLLLNWYLGGLHTPFYLGVQNGCYADHDIDLTINEGRGSGRAVQVVAAQGDTFGMSDAGSLMLGVAKGAPLKAVMSLLNTSGFGIISIEENGIETVEDLEGRSLAVSPGDALTQLFPAVVAANDLNGDAIDLVFMDPPAKPVAVMEGRADALLGGIDDQYFLIEEEGFEPTALRFADLGVNTVGMTIHTHEDVLAERPEMVQRFVTGTQCAWKAAMEDPEAAVDAALEVKPDLDRESTLKQLEVDLGLITSPNTKGEPIGYGAIEDWQRTKQLLVEYRDLETDEPADAFFTNEFVVE